MREFEFDRLVDAFRGKSPDEGLDALQNFLAQDLGGVTSDIYLIVDKVDPDDSSRSALCRLYPDGRVGSESGRVTRPGERSTLAR